MRYRDTERGFDSKFLSEKHEFHNPMARKLGEKGWLARVWPRKYRGQEAPYRDWNSMRYGRIPVLPALTISVSACLLLLFYWQAPTTKEGCFLQWQGVKFIIARAERA